MASTVEATRNTKRTGRKPAPVKDRILSGVKTDANGCWIWQRRTNNVGYGVITVKRDGKPVAAMAHRVAYEALRAPIPAGLHIDHLCRVRACVNPDHLEPVTCSENIRRSPIHVSAVNRTDEPGAPCTAEKHGTEWMRRRYGCCCIEAFEDERKRSRMKHQRRQERKAQLIAEHTGGTR